MIARQVDSFFEERNDNRQTALSGSSVKIASSQPGLGWT